MFIMFDHPANINSLEEFGRQHAVTADFVCQATDHESKMYITAYQNSMLYNNCGREWALSSLDISKRKM